MSAATKITARLPTILRTARAGIVKLAKGVKSAAPRVAGVVKQAVKSPIGKVAIGAVGVGAGLGLGSYLALSGFGAGQSYAQYATDQALAGQPPPGPRCYPGARTSSLSRWTWASHPTVSMATATAMDTATATGSPPSSPRRWCCSYFCCLSWGSY